MSDDQVVDRFVGNYESGGSWACSTDAYDHWFPPPGVRLEFTKHTSNGRVVARVKATNTGGWPADVKTAVEAAEYRVAGSKLTAEVTLPGSFTVVETLSMVDDAGGKMVHVLEFPDGEAGFWICPSKK